MTSKKELEIRLAAAQEEYARYDERLSHLAEINKKLETCYDQLRVAQTDAEYFKTRAEAAERRVADLEAAQEWRPVTEPPDKADWRSGFIVATESELVYYADEYNKGQWLWGDGWMKEITGVTHWQPLPLPPTPANSTPPTDSA